MQNLKVYENFGINESPEEVSVPQIVNAADTEVSTPTDHRVGNKEQEAIRAKLESDVKRMYPNISIKHSSDGQSGASIDNVVIYATDHYEAFNAFLFGLVMAKMHGGEQRGRNLAFLRDI